MGRLRYDKKLDMLSSKVSDQAQRTARDQMRIVHFIEHHPDENRVRYGSLQTTMRHWRGRRIEDATAKLNSSVRMLYNVRTKLIGVPKKFLIVDLTLPGLVRRAGSSIYAHEKESSISDRSGRGIRMKVGYENKSVSNRVNILSRLHSVKMKEGESIEAHYQMFDAIVTELRLAEGQAADDKESLTTLLLKSMPESFKSAVTAITKIQHAPC